MNVIINMENYEAFYLDFLEGNLDDEQLHAFTAFLDAHPELKMEEDLPSFSLDTEDKLDLEFIQSIKMFDVWETIREENYEKFMIASVEGILPATKQVELHDFMSKRRHLEAELKIYQKTKLEADLDVVYGNKSGLKKGMVIPMYAKWAAAAACLLLIVLSIPFNNNKIEAQFSATQLRTVPVKNTVINVADWSEEEVIPQKANQKSVRKSSKKASLEVIDLKETVRLEPLKIAAVTTNEEEVFVSTTLAVKAFTAQDEHEEDNTVALVQNDMKNPIPFFTKELNKRLKTDVELKTAKASKTKGGGFYFKFGKFEISRKTTPTGTELASN